MWSWMQDLITQHSNYTGNRKNTWIKSSCVCHPFQIGAGQVIHHLESMFTRRYVHAQILSFLQNRHFMGLAGGLKDFLSPGSLYMFFKSLYWRVWGAGFHLAPPPESQTLWVPSSLQGLGPPGWPPAPGSGSSVPGGSWWQRWPTGIWLQEISQGFQSLSGPPYNNKIWL